jgi:hypothetical protein
MEDVRAVFVNENAGVVVVILRVAADVIALIADQHSLPGNFGQTFGQHTSCKSSSNDQVIKHQGAP